MGTLPGKLQSKLDDRQAIDALRTLSVHEEMVDFSSNDYLGFAKDPQLYKDTLDFLEERGIHSSGSTGSRLLSGNSRLFEETESVIATFHQCEAALIFNSGYDANLGFLSSVPQREDLIIFDEYVHASIRDGIAMSNAKHFKFKHNDLADLENILSRNASRDQPFGSVYVVTESVFSMDGDSPDLFRMVDLCSRENCLLVVDEAHAIGIFGKRGSGLLQELELHDQVFARIVTFGKALGMHGAAILGSAALKEYLINFTRSFIYTTALSPHTVAGIYNAYLKLDSEQGIDAIGNLSDRIEFFKDQVLRADLSRCFIPSNSAIQSCLVPGNTAVKKIAKLLNKEAFDVKPILSPTIQKDRERLRFCLHSYNSEEQIKLVMDILAQSLNSK